MVGQPDSKIKVKSEAPVVNSAQGSSKRKRSNDEVEFIAKRPRREIDYFFCEMEKYFRWAKEAAEKGNKSWMEHCLSEAKKSAIEANATSDCKDRAAKVRQQLIDEKSYYLSEMEKYFRWAKEAAEKGNKSWMEHCLSEAKKSAIEANVTSGYDKQAMQIQIIFNTPEQMLKKSPAMITPMRNGNSQRKVQTSSNDEGDLVIEKEVDVHQNISNRLKEAERRGDVINIS